MKIKNLLLLFVLLPVIGNAQIIQTIVGNGTVGYSGDGGQATSAQISNPSGLAIDTFGNLYFSEYNNHTIRKVTPAGIISTYAGNGSAGYGGDGGPATAARLASPIKIALDNVGNLYFADYNNNRIRKISTSGIITTVAGTGSAGYSGDGGQATNAQLNHPSGVAVDFSGSLLISDYANYRIRKISSTGIISHVAGTGSAGSSGDGGPATSAQINLVLGLTTDIAGNIYLADASNQKIRKISASGTITTIAGNGVSGYGGDGGAATAAKFSNPAGITVDYAGNVFIGDQFNSRVRKVVPSGLVTTVVGTGSGGFSGDGGMATAANVDNVNETILNRNGDLILCDNFNNRIRIVTLCAVTIQAQPRNDTARINDTAMFITTTSMSTPVFQWQQNLSSSWVNLTNTYPYSGVNTGTLRIASASLSLSNSLYRCIISSGGHCPVTTNPAMLVISNLGVGQLINKDFKIFPNPSNDELNIHLLSAITSKAVIEIFDLYGRLVSKTATENEVTKINMVNQPAGVYLVKVSSDAGVSCERFTKN